MSAQESPRTPLSSSSPPPHTPRVSLLCSQNTNPSTSIPQTHTTLGVWQGEPIKASLLPLGPFVLQSVNSKIPTSRGTDLNVLLSAFPGTLSIQKPASQHPGNETLRLPRRLKDAYGPSAVTLIKNCKIQEHIRVTVQLPGIRFIIVAKALQHNQKKCL